MYYEKIENIELTDQMFNDQVLVVFTANSPSMKKATQLLKLVERHHKTGYVWCSPLSESLKVQVATVLLTWPPPHKESFTVEELFGTEKERINYIDKQLEDLIRSKAQKEIEYGTIRGGS